jgi:tripartite-type tricarboxylate transporter receptor subunit TctC
MIAPESGFTMTTATRWEGLPGHGASAWVGVGVPKNTPAEIIEILNKEINSALADPKMVAAAAEAARSVYWEQPELFNRAVLGFIAQYAK